MKKKAQLIEEDKNEGSQAMRARDMFKRGKLGCFTPVLVTFDVLSVSKIPMCWRPESEKKV